MDIAKYIGQFLLKNNVVYIHGLGNLELRRKPASYNGEALEPASISVALTPLGSIDDNLANFIATNEQVSISKASNELREFAAGARSELSSGKTVEIPAIGTFAEERGKIVFITNPQFQYTPPPIPTLKIARKLDETPFLNTADLPSTGTGYLHKSQEEEDDDTSGISWIKLGLWILALVGLIVASYMGYQYFRSQRAVGTIPGLPQLQENLPAEPQSAIPVADTMMDMQSPESAVIMDENQMLGFDVIINTYEEYEKAKRRTERLISYGNNVELVSEDDSSAFYVVMPISGVAPADTSRLLDSLRRTFNPSGVRILE